MRNEIILFYLDYVNNYLTVEKIAEHHGISKETATHIINTGRDYHRESTIGDYHE